MGKKILKIVGILLVLIIVVLIAAPFFLEAKIGEIIKSNVNHNVNATLDFSEANLSLISSFPNAEVDFKNVVLLNKAPFKGDTLFKAENLDLTMGIMQLFKNEGDAIAINNINLDGAFINVVVDKEENANYDIALASDPANTVEEEAGATDGFNLDLQSYEITNTRIYYTDNSTGIAFKLDDFQHTGTGDLSLATSELDTHTDAFISLEMDSVNYLSKNKIKLDALIGIDLNENKYSFLKNEALLNQLPLVFDGFIKLNETNQEVDLTFKTPSSDFKNFLGVIPEVYSKNIEDVTTTGNFAVNGNFKGVVDETHIPTFHIALKSDNASFKYPDLPKAVSNVFFDIQLDNKTGIAEDTYVNINKASFKIDEDKFNLTSNISELMGNTKVKAHMDGDMNLANISKAYPVPEEYNLKGMLKADITTAFDMQSVEKEQYEKTSTAGNLSLTDFEYNSEELANPVKFKAASLTFNPKTVTLNNLNGTTGTTDFDATGTINNLLGFMFNDEKVEGNFNLKSNSFALSDFMVAETETASTTGEEAAASEGTVQEEKIKIPSFLDATINADAKKVLYDDIVLSDVKGVLKIKDETATLSNMTAGMFGGKIAFNGDVSTKNETPTFNMKLDLNQLGIQETFASVDLFQTIAPIAKMLNGKLTSDISLSGNLTDDLMPNLLSLTGEMFADLMTEEVNTEDAPVLNSLVSNLNFIDLKQLNLKDLKTSLSFNDGIVVVKPFTLNYKDIAINVDGSHSFDQKLDYKATLQVPAKYLGSDITNLIAKIDDPSLADLTIPVVANIGGLYNSPQVSTDMTTGVKQLTNKLIEVEKQKLITKGTDKAKDLIGGLISGNKTSEDTTGTSATSTKTSAKDILGNILSTKKDTATTTSTKSDSVPVQTEKEAVKEKAKDILGGLFGKKKDSTK
ncbi:AsmA-like C-terminal region-containing protein [Maribacter sp. SA7]|uniref:AsmA-like C-terminal region-containing protein n=1 Tax=Maribacter zhoushanensis TaxID=3030012 RepID=UPI0023EA8E3D|nr:AsmA-like C-terminal region-containing protein [Maribacter zhoushanensis]MDF4202051.1 AsmA-like C-terminal region-containing protein [Maribacter zhoushanensis]